MEEFESHNYPNVSGDSSESADTVLQGFTLELQNIQRSLLESLQADMSRLQSEKTRLHDEIQRLRTERDSLIGEQHALVRQLGQVLANHISSKLESSLEALFTVAMERIDARVPPAGSVPPVSPTPAPQIDPDAILQPINQAIAQAFAQIQVDLNDYQSRFSQQLAQMQDEQSRGKAILGELVNRLRVELTNTSTPINPVTMGGNDDDAPHVEFEETGIPPFNRFESTEEVFVESTEYVPDPQNPISTTDIDSDITTNSPGETETGLFPDYPQGSRPTHPPIRVPASTTINSPSRTNEVLRFNQSGLILVGLSVIFSALYHVAIKVIFNPRSQILGAFTVEQLMTPNLANCLLILTLRMLVVVPLLLVLAPIMHVRVWQDLQVLFDAFGKSTTRRYPIEEIKANQRIVILSGISGAFLFGSQALIYFAISQIPVGVAIALFFTYPIVTGLLAWLLLQERFSRFRFGAIATICLGNLLVLSSLNTMTNPGNILLGCLAAIFAGITFAINILLSRICAARVHPVSYTLISFSTMMLLALASWLITLPLMGGVQSNGIKILEIILSAFILGVLSLSGYVLNQIGIRKFGSTGSAIAGATVPVLTVFFAGVIIQEQLTIAQNLGVLIVTLGVIGFSIEKIRHHLRNQRATN